MKRPAGEVVFRKILLTQICAWCKFYVPSEVKGQPWSCQKVEVTGNRYGDEFVHTCDLCDRKKI